MKAAYTFVVMGLLALGVACEDAPPTRPERSSHASPRPSMLVYGTAVSTQTIHVEAYIDGRSQLILQGNTARWYHLDWTAPGLYGVGANYPTKINGTDWFPTWPSEGPNLFCSCYSSTFTGVSPALPMSDVPVTLTNIQARDNATLIQAPNSGNDYTAIVEFNDDPSPAADWYIVELSFSLSLTASAGGPYIGREGSPVALDASATIATGGLVPSSYTWDFGDGATLTAYSPSVTHTYADNGSYPVTLTVTDATGLLTSSAATTAVIANETPVVDAGSPINIHSGQVANFAGHFTDPGLGDAPWAYSVSWGDGSSALTGSTSDQSIAIVGSHSYVPIGTYTVSFSVTDKDGASGSKTTTVNVTPLPVAIDVKPFNAANVISLSKDKSVPVAILSSRSFDATRINLSRLTLGDGNLPETLAIQGSSIMDANGDGILDLMVTFSTAQMQSIGDLTTSTTKLVLTGTHQNGVQFRGEDVVSVVK